MRKLIASEYEECKAFFEWSQTQPILKECLIKVCNEGIRTPAQAMHLRAIGMRPGVPDYLLPLANNKYNSLWLEMKRSDKVKQRHDPRQYDWVLRLANLGNYATFCYGWENAAAIVTAYLANQL